jgi:hypothetical protein
MGAGRATSMPVSGRGIGGEGKISMRFASRSTGVLFAALLAFGSGCASTPMPMPETEGEHIDDTAIFNRGTAAIVDEPPLSCPQGLPAAAVTEVRRG